MLRPLLIRSPLFPGESLLSLLQRLAPLNRCTVPELLALCGMSAEAQHPGGLIPDDRRAPFKSLHDLAILTGLTPAELFAATPHRFSCLLKVASDETQPPDPEILRFLPRALRGRFRASGRSQFCPECLRHQAYHRLMWMPQAIPVCLEHRCLLVDRCPVCHGWLSVAAIVQTRCQDCGADLRHAQPVSIAADRMGLQTFQVVTAWWQSGEIPDGFTSLPQQPAPLLFALYESLGQAIRQQAKRLQPYLHRPPPHFAGLMAVSHLNTASPAATYRIGATAFQALLEWPLGFLDFLDAYHCLVKPETPNQQVPMHWMFHQDQGLLDLTRQVLEDYRRLDPIRWPAPQAAPGTQSEVGAWMRKGRFTRLTLAAASRQLGVSVLVIHRLVRVGQLKEGGLRQMVWRKEVQELRRHKHRRITPETAASWLGIARTELGRLIQSDNVPEFLRPECANQLTVQRLLEFMNALAQRCVMWNHWPGCHWTLRPKLAEKMLGRTAGLNNAYLLGEVLMSHLTAHFRTLHDALDLNHVEYDAGEIAELLGKLEAQYPWYLLVPADSTQWESPGLMTD
jgi:hypothetical protein